MNTQECANLILECDKEFDKQVMNSSIIQKNIYDILNRTNEIFNIMDLSNAKQSVLEDYIFKK